MQAVLQREKNVMADKTIYMEIWGDNRVAYRVISGTITAKGIIQSTYGIEVETKRGLKKVKENIPNFSSDINSAVTFAELLVSKSIKPSALYNVALDYLGGTIQ